jgi:hypothetical protein
VHGFDDLGVVDALQIHGRDPEVAVAELTLDAHQRYALVGELDGVRVAQLVRSESAPNSGGRRGVAQLCARGRDRPAPTACRTGDDAEQRPDRELQPGGRPVVHADLAPASTLATTHQYGAAARVEIGLGERERLADPQPGTPARRSGRAGAARESSRRQRA